MIKERPMWVSNEEIHRDIAADIERDGRSIMCIGEGKNSPAFAYTIGNALVGLPELLMFGDLSVVYLLYDLSQMMVDRKGAFANGEVVDVGELVYLSGGFPLKIINATDKRVRDYTIQVEVHLGHENYAVQQVLMPDKGGRYAGDPECAPPYSNVPVLGTADRQGARE